MFWPLCAVAAQSTPIWWPAKLPGASVNQTFDTTMLPDPIYPAQITALSVQVQPSGEGELTATGIFLNGSIITVAETGGVSGRVYTFLFTVTLPDGEQPQWTIKQCCGFLPPPAVIPPAPDPGFGTEVNWMPVINVATGLIATGTNQSSAAATGAFTNIFSTVASGTGVIAPTWLTNGTIKYVNEGANTLSLYPVVGAQFIVSGTAQGANTAIGIPPGGVTSISTTAPLAQWTVT